ncbi:Transcriptional regulator, HxlR family protein [Alteracholeplasma palmae J233]|uniref:Transcriptional regulator, HxlR family protein n=1 Tax=Alteracholeplasma palmae (strain ATCC 49389 / J233) TaxID=1318466 RepID=U4KJN5_ALTPJ|nr:helix-turn-helix domain-containing protein [Alteracholeplasma palmae]CCV63627.1 Transcriptional regulator, HxlR family protein [Alteracholeplasma palmae J233]
MQIKNVKECRVNDALSIISGKWKPALLLTLINEGPKRFNELERELNGITPKMLASQLKSLESEGLIIRTQYESIPPKVTYEISKYGLELEKILRSLHDWGIKHNLNKEK